MTLIALLIAFKPPLLGLLSLEYGFTLGAHRFWNTIKTSYLTALPKLIDTHHIGIVTMQGEFPHLWAESVLADYQVPHVVFHHEV